MADVDAVSGASDMSPEISAADIVAALEAAQEWLAANRDGINAINVYPVPDGDTGTNMLLTLRAAIRGAPDAPSHVGELTSAVARAALFGARGNSGVIFSQMLRGFADALDGAQLTDRNGIVAALEAASATAYAAVSQPVEGTMLTVLREAAAAATRALGDDRSTGDVMRAAIDEAYRSVERTPDLLPRLREAGVVDSGGAGIAVILEGMSHGFGAWELPDRPRYTGGDHVALDAIEHEGHGYCTEYVVSGEHLDRLAMERALLDMGGDSTLVVGDSRTVHVHVHVADPGPALSVGVAVGALVSVKVENMQAQHEEWRGAHEDRGAAATAPAAPKALPALGLVAVATGQGIARAFRELGATVILGAGGKTSAGEMFEAARRAGREHVILLPNDGDLLMAAEACAGEADGFVTVIPTRNAAAGLAAAISYLPTGDPTATARAMHEAFEGVRCVEVSVSVRDATVDGVEVRRGQAIAFLDGRVVASCGSTEDALIAAVRDALDGGSSVVTVYLGEGVGAEDGARVRALIGGTCPGLEVDVVEGGQPHYPFLVSIE